MLLLLLNIEHIKGKDNIVADTLRRLPSANTERSEPSTETAQTRLNEMFTQSKGSSDTYGFPLDRSNVQRAQQTELEKRNSKLKNKLEDKMPPSDPQVISMASQSEPKAFKSRSKGTPTSVQGSPSCAQGPYDMVW